MADTLIIVGESGKVYEVSVNGVVEVTNPSKVQAASSNTKSVESVACAPESDSKASPGIMFTFVRLP